MTALVLFTRDLRVHDHPALAAAVGAADHVIPLFVFDPAVPAAGFGAPNRWRFLLDSLEDLDASLRDRGGALVVRHGAPAAVVADLIDEHGVTSVHVSGDVTRHAQRREQALRGACDQRDVEFEVHPGVTVVAPGAVAASGSDHYEVYTPYWRAWKDAHRRPVEDAPSAIALPGGIDPGALPGLADLTAGDTSPQLIRGGESAGRERLDAWVADGLDDYETARDDLAVEGSSRLSPFLHLGCLSAREIDERIDLRYSGAEAFLRQLCWRDFHHQVLWSHPQMPDEDHRPRGDRWRDDEDAIAAWKRGRTGYPLVDAGMRQLLAEGWMHNRARMVVASFLCKHLYVDWRVGAQHFSDLLVDGDVANNVANWQWVAGTGTDSRPNRVYNPVRQSERYDPDGVYIRRWVSELADVEGRHIHEPWELGRFGLEEIGYPPPIVEHAESVARFKEAREAATRP